MCWCAVLRICRNGGTHTYQLCGLCGALTWVGGQTKQHNWHLHLLYCLLLCAVLWYWVDQMQEDEMGEECGTN